MVMALLAPAVLGRPVETGEGCPNHPIATRSFESTAHIRIWPAAVAAGLAVPIGIVICAIRAKARRWRSKKLRIVAVPAAVGSAEGAVEVARHADGGQVVHALLVPAPAFTGKGRKAVSLAPVEAWKG